MNNNVILVNNKNRSTLKNIPVTLCLSLLMFLLAALASYFISGGANNSASWLAEHVGTATIVQFSVMTLAMLLVWRHDVTQPGRNSYVLLIVVGIAARLILLGVDSYTSNDVSRYLFDGKLLLEGFDPYRTAHNHPDLAALVAQWQPPQEHLKYPTLYPPLALGFFTLSASFGAEYATFAWKCTVAIFSIATLLAGAVVLKKANRKQHFALLALSPLLVLESGIGGHIDTLTTLLVCLTLWAWLDKKPLLVGVFIALGALLKFLPLALLLPVLLTARYINGRIDWAIQVITGLLVTLLLVYGVALHWGIEPVGSIGVFFQKWRFGSPLFTVLNNILPDIWVLIAIGILMLAGVTVAARHCMPRSKGSCHWSAVVNAAPIAAFIMALPLLMSPVVFPWYLMPLMPLLALAPRLWLLVWVLLLPFSYEVLNQFVCCNQWQPAQWPLVLIGTGLCASILPISKRWWAK